MVVGIVPPGVRNTPSENSGYIVSYAVIELVMSQNSLASIAGNRLR